MEDLKFSNVHTFGKLLKKKVIPNFSRDDPVIMKLFLLC